MKAKRASGIFFGILLALFLLTVVTPAVRAAEPVEVGDSLALANQIGTVQNGGTLALKLTNDIALVNYFSLNGAHITFDLNGHTLTMGSINVTNGGSVSVVNTDFVNGNAMNTGDITVAGGSIVAPAGSGVLNVNGEVYADGAGSSVTAGSVSNNSHGVMAANGGQVTVNGDITVTTGYTGVYGVGARSGGKVTVNGDITVNGYFCYGVYIYNGNSGTADSSGTDVTVTGSITANGATSGGVIIENSSNWAVSVGGSITASNRGVLINGSCTGNRVTVGGGITVTGGGQGVSTAFGSGHTITVTGDVTVNGDNAYGGYVGGTGNAVLVEGSIFTTGDDASGIETTGENTVTVDGDVITAYDTENNPTQNSDGVTVSGSGSTVTVGGNVTASGTGVYSNYSGSVTVHGDVSVSVSDTYSYIGVYVSSGGTAEVDGDVRINGVSSVTGVSASGSGSTITVDGGVSAASTGSSSTGAYVYDGATVQVGGDISATGASSVTGILSAYGSAVTAGGAVSANGGIYSNTGVYASSSSSVTVDKAIAAASYVKIYTTYPSEFSIGGGTLNSGSGYFEYSGGGNTVRVKAWTLNVAADTGGLAGIGGTAVTSGVYEAGRSVNITAVDTVMGYDFDHWTSSAGGSFGSAGSASTTFIIPAADATVTAGFQTVPLYNVDISSAMTGGEITASPSPAEEGDTVTLTVVPDPDRLFAEGSLKYSYGSTDYPLTVTGSTASFVMPGANVTVSAEFENITVPTITTVTLPDGIKTVSYSHNLTHGSNAPAVWSLAVGGSLPDGLSLSAGGVISGTPTTAGTYTFTLQAANGGGSDTQELTLVIVPAEPVITTASLPDATEDEAYSFSLSATGAGNIYWYFSGGSFPAGLYLQSDGSISGTPAAEIDSDASYTFNIKAESYVNGNYVSDTKEFTLIVHPAPEYALTLQDDGHGSITAGEGGSYEEGFEISIGAAPDTGYVFSGWTSSDGGSFDDETSASTIFTMPGNSTTVTANFATGYEITIDSMEGGSVAASPVFAGSGTDITLTVTPEPGMRLKEGSLKYSHGGMDYPLAVTGSTASFAMPGADVTVSAEFEEKTAVEAGNVNELEEALESFVTGDTIKLTDSFTYTDPITIDGKTVTFNTNGYALRLEVTDNTALTVTNSGNVRVTGTGALDVWSNYYGVIVGMGGSANVTNVEVEGNYSYAVSAENGTVTVNGDVSAKGYNSCAVYAGIDSTVTVHGNIAAEDDGSCAIYAYYGDATVDGDVSAYGYNSYGVYSDSESTVTVHGNITASGSSSVGVYAVGSTVTAGKAITAPFYIIVTDYWGNQESFNIGEGELNGATGYFEYTDGSQSTLVCVKAWNITAETVTGGSIAANPAAEAGDTVSLEVTPDTGKRLKTGSLKYNDGTDHAITGTSFTMPAVDVTVTAEFEALPVTTYTVAIGTLSGGGISANPTTAAAEETINLIVTPDAGKRLKTESLKYNDGTDHAITGTSFTMPAADVTVTAEFEDVPHTVTNADKVAADKEALNIGYGSGDSPTSVTKNLTLTVTGAVYGSDITWVSDNTAVISNTGVVTRPFFESGDAGVTVTAEVYNEGARDTKGFYLVVLKLPQIIYTVTFDKNGGNTEANPAAMSVASGGNTGNLPTPPARTGYTFIGWNTAADGRGAAFTAATAITANIRVYAQWTVNNVDDNDNNGPASGGSNPSPVPSSPPSPPAGEQQTQTSTTGNTVTTTTAATATVNGSGKASAAVTREQVSGAISEAVAEAQRQGIGTAARIEIRVEVPANSATIETNIPKEAVSQALTAGIGAVTVSTPVASITFDAGALSTISGEASGDIKITASAVEASDLLPETQTIVGDRPVFDFSVISGDRTIAQFGGNVTVSVPYTPGEGEDLDSIIIYYINGDGNPVAISDCRYDPATGSVTFSTSHFSRYAVGYNKVTFKDVAENAWYYKAVSFIAARGITAGTGEGNFRPDGKLTRGQFITMLMKACGMEPDTGRPDNFSDAGDTWYTGYLAAAKRLGISGGVGNNMFVPDREITRQEMFTLLYNALAAMDRLPESRSENQLSAYSDAGEIASWAKDAMTLLVKTGTINGSGGKLLPTDTTTRAEMAQVLYKLLEK